MKVIVPILLALLVGVGNVPYVYGFKKAFSGNPFIYAGMSNLLCGIALLTISSVYGGAGKQYLTKNWIVIGVGALGIVVANIAIYFVITRFGASFWLLCSLFIMLIPSFIVGYLIFKENCNVWIVPCVVCALLTVLFFGLSKR